MDTANGYNNNNNSNKFNPNNNNNLSVSQFQSNCMNIGGKNPLNYNTTSSADISFHRYNISNCVIKISEQFNNSMC